MNSKICKRISLSVFSLLLSVSIASCGQNISDYETKTQNSANDTSSVSSKDTDSNNNSDSNNNESSNSDNEKKTGKTTARLVCAGDNLIHNNIYWEAEKENGGYDFSKFYKPCERLIKGADVAILNQESLVNDAFEAETFPDFSTPTECGDAVVDLGFNVISMSNNHVLDMGSKGLISSLDYWDTKDVVHYGAYRSEEDSENIKTKTVNGITFAFLGYMEHTNYNHFIQEGEEGKVVYLEEEDTIKRQIEKADKIADVVIVSCHYGKEIEHELNPQQINLTPKLVEWGADLIIGTQSHALSTCTYLDKPNGDKAFVFYGLGNFFSTMDDKNALVGFIGDLNVVKDYDNNKISFENIKCIPVVSHYEGVTHESEWYNCMVYPLKDYTDELLQKHFMYTSNYYSYDQKFNRQAIQNSISYIPEEFLSIE